MTAEARTELFSRIVAYTKDFDAKYGTSIFKDMIKNGFPS